MSTQITMKKISAILTTATTILVMLLLLAAAQGIIIAVSNLLTLNRQVNRTVAAEQEPIDEKLSIIRGSSKSFMPDGTLHLVKQVKDEHRHAVKPERVQIYDVNANLIWEGLKEENPYEYLSWAKAIGWRDGMNKRQMNNVSMITPELSQALEIPVFSDEQVDELWRYNSVKRYFVGYKNADERIGYLGANGFVEDKSQAESLGKFRWFTAWSQQGPGNVIMLWQVDRKIYQIDFENRLVKLLFTSEDASIERVFLHHWRLPDIQLGAQIHYRPAIFCKTEDNKLHLIMRQPAEIMTVAVPAKWGNFSTLTATDDSVFLTYMGNDNWPPAEYPRTPKSIEQWRRQRQGMPINRWIELYSVDQNSKLKLINRFDWQLPPYKVAMVTMASDQRSRVQRYVSDFSPPLYSWIIEIFGKKLWQWARSSDDNIMEMFAEILRQLRPGHTTINWLLSIMVTALALWHGWARRTSSIKLIFWLIFVAVLGLAGFLVYIGLNHTALISCPVCGKKRGLTRVGCVRCGQMLPVPRIRDVDKVLTGAG